MRSAARPRLPRSLSPRPRRLDPRASSWTRFPTLTMWPSSGGTRWSSATGDPWAPGLGCSTWAILATSTRHCRYVKDDLLVNESCRAIASNYSIPWHWALSTLTVLMLSLLIRSWNRSEKILEPLVLTNCSSLRQALFHTPALVNYLKHGDHENSCGSNGFSSCTICSMAATLRGKVK